MRQARHLAVAGLLGAGLIAAPAVGHAVTQENFLARTTGDLVATCSAKPGDPLYVAAMHFCEGFMIGAYRYHEAESAGSKGPHLFCLPTSGLTRDQAVSMFVQWAQANPQYSNERPIDSLVRFAQATWPCPQK